MADNVDLTSPAGSAAADEVSDGTLGTVKVQYVKLMDGTLNGTNKVAASSTKGLSVNVTNANEYEFVAASATSQALGATGASGDFLSHLTIIPATTSPGAVSLQDGAGTDRTVFAGGASSVSNLQPFHVILGAASVNGAWKVTTGTNVSVYAFGDFT